MAFTRVNPLGWALFEELTSAQMNQLDLNASRAIDGTFGGTYNPSGPININGTLNVTNIDVGTLTGDAVFTSLTVNGPSIFNGTSTFNGTASITGGMVISSNVVMNYGTFQFASPHVFVMSNGTFQVESTASAIFGGDVTFSSGASITSQANWTFTGGSWYFNSGTYANVSGSWYFSSRPSFADGVTFAAGELVNYSTSQAWVVRFPFAAGGGPRDDSLRYSFDTNGYWKQIDNSVYPARLWCYPQGLWGGTPVELIAAEIRTKANGLSGTPTGTTYFNLFITDQDMEGSVSATITDPSPNSSSNHSCSWSGSLTYTTNTNIIGLVFFGYRGGDTLDAYGKNYCIKSGRFTFRTDAKGVY